MMNATLAQTLHAAAPDLDARARRDSPEYRDAFRAFVQDGAIARQLVNVALPGDLERRALGTSGGTLGGFIVSQEFDNLILQAADSVDVVRQLATKRPSTSGTTAQGYLDDTGNMGELLAENGAVSEQDLVFGGLATPVFSYSSKFFRVGYQLMNDAGDGFEAMLADVLGKRVGRKQNLDFTRGSGAGEPHGLCTVAPVGVQGQVGQTTSVTWDDLVNLQGQVSEAYLPTSKYMMAPSTWTYVKRLIGGDGHQLWQPAPESVGGQLDGFPIVLNPNMPAMAPSARSVLFGDFSAYVIRDITGSGILVRDRETLAGSLQVRFAYVARAGGELPKFSTAVPITAFANSAT